MGRWRKNTERSQQGLLSCSLSWLPLSPLADKAKYIASQLSTLERSDTLSSCDRFLTVGWLPRISPRTVTVEVRMKWKKWVNLRETDSLNQCWHPYLSVSLQNKVLQLKSMLCPLFYIILSSHKWIKHMLYLCSVNLEETWAIFITRVSDLS